MPAIERPRRPVSRRHRDRAAPEGVAEEVPAAAGEVVRGPVAADRPESASRVNDRYEEPRRRGQGIWPDQKKVDWLSNPSMKT